MSFDEVLDITMELPLEEREELIEILRKRIIEEKRNDLASYYKQVKEDYRKGKLKSKPVNEIIDELEKELDD